jgi:hypothetical protein
MKVKSYVYIILNTSRKHVNYEEDKNKVYNIQNTNICNGIFHISFFKALLINEGETYSNKLVCIKYIVCSAWLQITVFCQNVLQHVKKIPI